HVAKGSVAIVFVEPIRRALGRASEAGARKHKQVHPTVVVVVNKGAAASRGFDDVLFEVDVAVDYGRVQTGGSRDVDEARMEGTPRSFGPRQGLGRVRGNTLRQQPICAKGERSGPHAE